MTVREVTRAGSFRYANTVHAAPPLACLNAFCKKTASCKQVTLCPICILGQACTAAAQLYMFCCRVASLPLPCCKELVA